jgi:hypothetical protein
MKLTAFESKNNIQEDVEIDTVYLNTPIPIAHQNYLPDWETKHAIRELISNFIDQATKVHNTNLDFFRDAKIEIVNKNNSLIIFCGGSLLAEASWGLQKIKYVTKDVKGGIIKLTAKQEVEHETNKKYIVFETKKL